MDAVIRISMDNAAFEGNQGGELAQVLRSLIEKIEHMDTFGNAYDGHISLRDTNGNMVGAFDIVRD